MAGLLTHLLVSSAGFLMVFYLSKKIYAATFSLGQLVPDLLDFGIAGIKQGSLNPSTIIHSPWFNPLKIFGHSFFNWLVIALIIFTLIYFLYKLEKISKNKLIMAAITIIFFLCGILIHIILDLAIIEANHWI
ncbi:MAG: hypothetical protein WC548_01125 [Candidatus Pacearchaeota archaeon]